MDHVDELNVSTTLDEVIKKIEEEHCVVVISIVSDNFSGLTSGINNLTSREEWKNIIPIRCSAHSLQLFIKDLFGI